MAAVVAVVGAAVPEDAVVAVVGAAVSKVRVAMRRFCFSIVESFSGVTCFPNHLA